MFFRQNIDPKNLWRDFSNYFKGDYERFKQLFGKFNDEDSRYMFITIDTEAFGKKMMSINFNEIIDI